MYENLLAPKPMAPKQSFNISKHSMWKYENSKITKHVSLCMHSNLENLIRHSVWYNFFLSRVKQSETKKFEGERERQRRLRWESGGLSFRNTSNNKAVVGVWWPPSEKDLLNNKNTRKLRKHFVWTFNFN